MKTSNGALAENKSLTSIRGIAALWVVGHHWLAKSSVPWVQTIFGEGFRAVDIFFVLSGLILAFVYRELRFDAMPRFMAQRVFRLYPLHMVALLFLAIVFQLPGFYAPAFLTPDFAGSMLLLQAFVHVNTTVNPVSWSISIEMFLYLMFPVLLFVLQGLERLRKYRMALSLLLLVLFAAQLYQMRHNYGTHFGWDAMMRGLNSFLLGMVLAKCCSAVKLSKALASAIEVSCCAAICVALALHQSAFIPGLAAVMIFSLSFDKGIVAVALRQRIWLWLGHISFSIYLLHYPIQVAMDKFSAFEALGAGDLAHKLLRLGSMLAVLLVASTLAYRYLETPCRRIPARFSAWRKSFAVRRWQVAAHSSF